MSKTAAELRSEAAALRAEAAESFERCDTDGFLSQWASSITARQRDAQAQIAEAGGTAWFARWELWRGGRRMDARRIETRYGTKWRIDETDEWMTYGSARAAKRRGYELRETIERAAARAIIAGEGTGLSGAANAYIAIIREGAKRSDGWRSLGASDADKDRYCEMIEREGLGL